MKLSYYPGCSLHSTAAEFSASTEAVFKALGVELQELGDWCCCGATSGHSLNSYLSHALPLHNLILAEAAGNDLLVPCAACYNSLKAAQTFMAGGSQEARELNQQAGQILEREYRGEVQVRHVVDMLADDRIKALLEERLQKRLAGLPLAAYYGCLLTRPPKVASFEANPEQPRLMDRLLARCGATPVGWTHKNECCGASLAIPQPQLVEQLVGKITAAARYAGAAAIVTACPLCQTNLDSRQPAGAEPLPVFFITEIIGLALGLDAAPWLKKHLVDPLPLLRQQGLLVAS
ncbi:8-methylmenaquinol:fumarate reductase membrane anchor subunit [Neomoorella glycerini]|uniref:8-methylmenaquinol:fumarate reductase membrane anchor subunit n=1 Tax=Neomoorella glycerini TaxID=55779 RepID=A0A6I5ZVC3_9FIRM|nr:CoB--CoM heterodisulfide reductase iron-sulfur subunit B family protein [Moorella glycerini]QGP93568.1 8-methylmenaquinol:fumarate reductase membrane anchor subunit [Moorella glycerini]